MYYRDDRGLEVDAIVECGDRWAGIEVKLSDTKADEGAESLLKLRDRVTSNLAAKNASLRFLPSSWVAGAWPTRAKTACW